MTEVCRVAQKYDAFWPCRELARRENLVGNQQKQATEMLIKLRLNYLPPPSFPVLSIECVSIN